ncbi:MAG: hypothetical protein Q4F77_00250 [Acinetobacter sp.]|uniref:hypothetical protein n=1 Tax=Acinetobacter sp. TaxID=472 RepID=UPI0026E01146|nr:hypothetical protein [Acinetobacter sp.]MDO5541713.1 hypothetical protein [Acinetobacter sp.]
MAANTDIKFYVHTNNNAPQLQNSFGCMIDVLDACLVNGFSSQTVSTLTASGTTVTATFGSAHNFMQYQVIKITGAAQAEFNGEHRILTIPDSSSLTFELATAPSVPTATGIISASLPPLGWEKPFSSSNPNGGGKAAYRSLNLLLPSRPFLRVVDELDPAYTATYAKYAKVGIVEDMTDIDTMLGVQAPFDPANPDKNWVGTGSGTAAINGWAKWYYASSAINAGDSIAPAAGNRQWLLVGNKDYLYIMPSHALSRTHALLYGFGIFERVLETDVSNTFLVSTYRYVAAGSTAYRASYTGGVSNGPNANILLQRNYLQESKPAVANCESLSMKGQAIVSSGVTNYLTVTTDDVLFSPVFINENIFRGKLPLINWLYRVEPIPHKTLFVKNSEIFMGYLTEVESSNFGELVVKVGDL